MSAEPAIHRLPWVAEPPEPIAAPTLREVYERHYRPKIALRADKTREAYEDALSHWERYTHDPPVSDITSELLCELQAKLARRQRRGKPISASTVDKTFRHLRPLIDLCMPRDRVNPRGLGLIDYLEYPGTLTKSDPKPQRFTSDEMDRLYRACRVATWPRRVEFPAPLLWRVAIVCLYNLGPRVYDLFSRDWSDVAWEFRDEEGRLIHPFGSVEFRATKTRKQQRIPFNAVVQAHLLAIRRPSGRIFPGRWKPTNKTKVNDQWGRIVEAAGITHKPLAVFRDTCDTAAHRVVKGAGDWILGHGAKGVNARNYYDPSDDVFETVLGMPQPPAFVEHVASDRASRHPRLLVDVARPREFAWAD